MAAKESKNTYLLIFFLSFIIGVVCAFKFLTLQNSWTGAKVTINNKSVSVEIVNTPDKISQGLSGREKLDPQSGMLFILGQTDTTFWMGGMKFNLDFIFIKNDTVVYTVENVPYPKEGEKPITITPNKEFNKVLEVNAGTIKMLNIKVNDRVNFTF